MGADARNSANADKDDHHSVVAQLLDRHVRSKCAFGHVLEIGVGGGPPDGVFRKDEESDGGPGGRRGVKSVVGIDPFVRSGYRELSGGTTSSTSAGNTKSDSSGKSPEAHIFGAMSTKVMNVLGTGDGTTSNSGVGSWQTFVLPAESDESAKNNTASINQDGNNPNTNSHTRKIPYYWYPGVDARSLPFPDKVFDCCISNQTMCALGDSAEDASVAVKELERVCHNIFLVEHGEPGGKERMMMSINRSFDFKGNNNNDFNRRDPDVNYGGATSPFQTESQGDGQLINVGSSAFRYQDGFGSGKIVKNLNQNLNPENNNVNDKFPLPPPGLFDNDFPAPPPGLFDNDFPAPPPGLFDDEFPEPPPGLFDNEFPLPPAELMQEIESVYDRKLKKGEGKAQDPSPATSSSSFSESPLSTGVGSDGMDDFPLPPPEMMAEVMSVYERKSGKGEPPTSSATCQRRPIHRILAGTSCQVIHELAPGDIAKFKQEENDSPKTSAEANIEFDTDNLNCRNRGDLVQSIMQSATRGDLNDNSNTVPTNTTATPDAATSRQTDAIVSSIMKSVTADERTDSVNSIMGSAMVLAIASAQEDVAATIDGKIKSKEKCLPADAGMRSAGMPDADIHWYLISNRPEMCGRLDL